jgi:hypothetical protein
VIRAIDILLQDWANAVHRLETSCLGYQVSADPRRLQEGHSDTPGGHPTVPGFWLPARLLPIDRAVRDLPTHLARAIELRYLSDLDRKAQETAYRTLHRRAERNLYVALDLAHHWLAGRLSAQLDISENSDYHSPQ